MKALFIPLFVLTLVSTIASPQSPSLAPPNPRSIAGLTGVSIEPARRVRSKEFEWDHEIQVALPASYRKSSQQYPVLWITDGAAYFELAVKTVNYDLMRHVPEMIVVAVGAPSDDSDLGFGFHRNFEFLPNRTLGFTGFGAKILSQHLTADTKQEKVTDRFVSEGGGAAKFLGFLVDELRTTLAKEYRMGDDHTLFGDSSGGAFCVFALLARPESFSRYICGSPPLNAGDYELFRMEERYAQTHKDLKAIVFFGAGEAEMLESNIVPAWGVVSSTARMVEILGSRRYPSLKLVTRIFPGEDHASVVPVNLSWGLRSVWRDSMSGAQ